MKEDTLLQLLKIFDKTTWKQLKDFVYSPFFNKNKKVMALFELYTKAHPHFSAKQVDIIYLTKKLYGKADKRTQQQLRNRKSELKKLVEQFLIQTKADTDPVYQQCLLLHSLQQHKLYTLFDKHYQHVQQQQEQLKRDEGWYYNQYLLHQIHYNTSIIQSTRKLDNNLETVINQQNVYIILQQLKYYYNILNSQQILTIPYSKKWKHYFDTNIQQQLINNKELNSDPLIKLYLSITTLLKATRVTSTHFDTVQQQLDAYHDLIHPFILRNFYTIALNYCLKQYYKGHTHFLTKMLALYKSMLAANLLINEEEKYLNLNHYTNINRLALRTGNTTWAVWFTETYKTHLHPNEQENSFQFNLTTIAFYQKNYQEALDRAQTIEKIDFFYHIDKEMLLIKSTIELLVQKVLERKKQKAVNIHFREIEGLEAIFNRFRMYIERNEKLSEKEKMAYQQFILVGKKWVTLFNKMIDIPYQEMGQQKVAQYIQRLAQNIQEHQQLIDKKWLVQTVDKLVVFTQQIGLMVKNNKLV